MRSSSMRLTPVRVAFVAGALATASLFVGPAFAVERATTEHCEELAARFKVADVSHMSPEKLESVRRQAAHGARLCKSAPETGVKALNVAFRDIGIATPNEESTSLMPPRR
jgi:hypothetical protein